MKIVTAIYQIIIGMGMIGIWVMLFFSHQIPELQTEVMRITLHITAEIITGSTLLFSGVYILFKKKKHKTLFNISFGALIYTLIASPGYYAQKTEWGVVIVFLLLLFLTVLLAVLNNKE